MTLEKETTLETILNYTLTVMFFITILFPFAYIPSKVIEYVMPCCYGCASCLNNNWICLIPTMFTFVGITFSLGICIVIRNKLRSKL
jgi:hypothetical protein